MELVWNDEFDGDGIDPTNWTYDIGGWGWGNGEAQYYTDRPKNARTANGLLVIELHQEQFEDSYYTSARLKTQELREFQYGWIEGRIKVPKGAGTWPAFWMLGSGFQEDAPDPANQWPKVGEIDIMEYVGREPDLVLGTVHGPGYAGAGGRTKWNRQDFEIGDDFHTFAIDWDAEGIRWYFDGEQYFDLRPHDLGDREWVFDKPFFMILNLALGGTLGGLPDRDLVYPILRRLHTRLPGPGPVELSIPRAESRRGCKSASALRSLGGPRPSVDNAQVAAVDRRGRSSTGTTSAVGSRISPSISRFSRRTACCAVASTG